METSSIRDGVKYPYIGFTGTDAGSDGGGLQIPDSVSLNIESTFEVYIDMIVRFNAAVEADFNSFVFYRVENDAAIYSGQEHIMLYGDASSNLIFRVGDAANSDIVQWNDFLDDSLPDSRWRRVTMKIDEDNIYLSVDGKDFLSTAKTSAYDLQNILDFFIGYKNATLLTLGSAIPNFDIMKFYVEIESSRKVVCDFRHGQYNKVIDYSGEDNHMVLDNMAEWSSTKDNVDQYLTNEKLN